MPIHSEERCRPGEFCAGLLADFARKRFAEALAGLHAAAGKIPARQIGMLHQQDAIAIDQHGPHAERHAPADPRVSEIQALRQAVAKLQHPRARLARATVEPKHSGRRDPCA